jgi:hypothetical protein
LEYLFFLWQQFWFLPLHTLIVTIL